MKPTRLTETRQQAWFLVYYQMGVERSLENLRLLLGEIGVKVSSFTLESYSARFGWQAKIAEMDEKARQRTMERVLDTKVEMNLRHVTLARALGGVASAALMELRGNPKEISGGEAARMLEIAQKMERLAVGEVTERREVVVSIINVLVKAVVALFMEVNALPDPQERIDRFAFGFDEAVDKYLAEGREEFSGA